MTGTITTAMAATFKQEIMMGGHCLIQSQSFTGNTHSNTFIDNIATGVVANLAVGMTVWGSGIPANATIAQVVNTSSIIIAPAATTSLTGTALVANGDLIYMALIKFGPTASYGANTTNYANVTGNSDEGSGSGYTAGGTQLTTVTPSVYSGSNVAITNFSPNPSWTSATLDVAGCLLYNNGTVNTSIGRIGNVTGRAISLHDFGGEQKVTAGTFTVNMPSANSIAAILRIA